MMKLFVFKEGATLAAQRRWDKKKAPSAFREFRFSSRRHFAFTNTLMGCASGLLTESFLINQHDIYANLFLRQSVGSSNLLALPASSSWG